jgi:hypothetical protein
MQGSALQDMGSDPFLLFYFILFELSRVFFPNKIPLKKEGKGDLCAWSPRNSIKA